MKETRNRALNINRKSLRSISYRRRGNVAESLSAAKSLCELKVHHAYWNMMAIRWEGSRQTKSLPERNYADSKSDDAQCIVSRGMVYNVQLKTETKKFM